MNWEGVRERKCGGEGSGKRENKREAEEGEIVGGDNGKGKKKER